MVCYRDGNKSVGLELEDMRESEENPLDLLAGVASGFPGSASGADS